MIKNILIIAAAACLACTSADASSLVRMDIKKTSENAVDITFYTTGSSLTPLPTRKSNNKYVILMPDVTGKSAGTPDLSAVKDLITDVNIKNVDDGMSGYTKVTVITTKPVNIKTRTEKTAPLTQEEKEAKNVIAQAKTHPQQTVAPTESKVEAAKTSVTSSASAPAAKQTTSAAVKQVKKAEPVVTKPVETRPVETFNVIKPQVEKPVTTVAEEPNKLDIKEVEKIEKISKSELPKKHNTGGWVIIIFPILLLYLFVRAIKNSIQNSNILKASFKEHLEEKPVKQENYDDIINNSDLNWQERYQKFVKESKGEMQKHKYRFISDSLSKTSSRSSDTVNTQEKTDKKHLEPSRNTSKPSSGPSDVVNTQEKTDKKHLEPSRNTSKPSSRPSEAVNTQEKTDKKRPEPSRNTSKPSSRPSDTVNTQEKQYKEPSESAGILNKTDEKRLELENTLNKTPEIYKPHEIDMSEDKVPEVKSEDDVIQREISTVKLKAFAKPLSLHTSHRNRVKKTIVTNPQEGKFVKLRETPLNASKRKFAGANLKVSDLIKAGNRYLENRDEELIAKQQNYIMSSIDEYFALLDKEQSKSKSASDLSEKVAASLAQVKPSMNMQKSPMTVPLDTSNPFTKQKDYLNGLVVKSGYNIDETRGFYLVSLDGVSALVGRVGDEIFVLKKFDDNVDKLQVRPDSGNVYMVKAGDFKSLVDVDEKRMGVLIEL